jgi:hypothetical protein
MPIEGREQPSKVPFAWMISSVVIQIHAVVCLFVGELLAKRRIESPLPEITSSLFDLMRSVISC